ncbi:MAG: YHS domain-containing protein [Sedimentisphaerales bacterium]|jgi:YHS domain-containing protein
MITQKMVLVVAVAMIGLIGLVGCKKKEQMAAPKTPTMEGMMKQAATAEEANKTAATAVASMEQTTCPVMDGNKIDKNVFVEYKGKKVYFCCAGCKEEFEKAPEKYIAKLPQFTK